MKNFLAGFWEQFGDRVGGPMTFRIILQPAMAALLAVRAGLQDARQARPPYFWTLLIDPAQRIDLLREGWRAIIRVFILAVIMDVIYEVIVLRSIRPLDVLIVATLLAVVPYLLIRGPVNRVARRWRRKECPPADG